jgi:hypothetical protein
MLYAKSRLRHARKHTLIVSFFRHHIRLGESYYKLGIIFVQN